MRCPLKLKKYYERACESTNKVIMLYTWGEIKVYHVKEAFKENIKA
jgi:hypothetical protein